jgi:thioredoxin reductase
MESWTAHMPKGMFLKSDGFASNLYDPKGEFTLKRYCAERGIVYADLGTPVARETFTSYGLAFRNKMVPEVEEKLVTRVVRDTEGYLVEVEGGGIQRTKRVIVAVGITHFAYVPSELQHLKREHFTHSFEHSSLEQFRGQSVAVIGSGSSAIDLAALLHEIEADVRIVGRDKQLKFHDKMRKDRSLWERMRAPLSGLGPGLKSRFYADAPNLFWYFPEQFRLKVVRTALGPSGGWFAKDKVVGKVPMILNSTIKRAEAEGNGVRLELNSQESRHRELRTQHVIAATGYKVDLERLAFLAPEIRRSIRSVDGTPALSSRFESSVPGLYFVGLAAANSFGPVMRFAYGAAFAARRLTRVISESFARGRAMIEPIDSIPPAKQPSPYFQKAELANEGGNDRNRCRIQSTAKGSEVRNHKTRNTDSHSAE